MTRGDVTMTSVSLDGAIEHMEQRHFDFINDEPGQLITEQLAVAEVLHLGRRTYEGWAKTWPSETDEIADK